MNTKLIGTVVAIVAVVAVGAAVIKGNNGGSPNDPGGFFEGGAMGGNSGAQCQAACNALEQQIKELKDARAKNLFEGAGCSEGSGGDWTGTIAGGYQFICPTQSAAEALGDAIGEMKDNPSAADREIDALEKEFEDNCPCNQPQPGAMIRIPPPYLIICPDGTSLSGNPKGDEQGNAILDAAGNYIDSVTGNSVMCP